MPHTEEEQHSGEKAEVEYQANTSPSSVFQANVVVEDRRSDFNPFSRLCYNAAAAGTKSHAERLDASSSTSTVACAPRLVDNMTLHDAAKVVRKRQVDTAALLMDFSRQKKLKKALEAEKYEKETRQEVDAAPTNRDSAAPVIAAAPAIATAGGMGHGDGVARVGVGAGDAVGVGGQQWRGFPVKNDKDKLLQTMPLPLRSIMAPFFVKLEQFLNLDQIDGWVDEGDDMASPVHKKLAVAFTMVLSAFPYTKYMGEGSV